MKNTALAGLAVGAGGFLVWQFVPKSDAILSLKQMLKNVDLIEQQNITMLGQWNLSKTLLHCAQSIDLSIDGYPQHHSTLFKQTVGTLAFSGFSAKHQMHHALDKDIPGTQPINADTPLPLAIESIRLSIKRFAKHSGKLKEHFAYGQLNKNEYERAHAMHLNNHMLEMAWE
ncbi:DUF1569 domain-containing protein [Ningiella sp. W23]|uniref:DUF1569 domain-containing protein n=1 Tax=Ningiella sp. W23 TaxID=3023715 RepID=UPI0039F5DD89